MADSSSDVLRKEFYLFIHRNALRTQQIGFNVASKGPGPMSSHFLRPLWCRLQKLEIKLAGLKLAGVQDLAI